MDAIQRQFAALAAAPSDINEHLPVLRAYARECVVAAEMGVRDVVSTWALLCGLAEAGGADRALWCVDVVPPPNDRFAAVADAARAVGVRVTFLEHDSATLDLPTDVDLLFVDTWHVYGHLRRELARHAPRVRRYILLHDTVVDRYVGESVRRGQDVAAQHRATGYPVAEIRRGLWPAVEEFLRANADWELWEQRPNNNGLTVLRRRPHPLPDGTNK